jgi:hypothetical protein
MQDEILTIELSVWNSLVSALRLKGKGKRESGAFLLGPIHGNTITEFICYDDLYSKAFSHGIITFAGVGYLPLWERCAADGLKVLADVHTHPGRWTSQSQTDMENPMIATKGHIALIIPQFAMNNKQSLRGVGIHEYLGDHKWKSISKKSKTIQIKK